MRPAWKNPTQQPRNDTAADLSDGNEHFPIRSTGNDRMPDGLFQRRPWKGNAHQDVFDLPSAIQTTKITYRTLKSTAEVWLVNRAITYTVFIALILGSAATAGLAVWKATIESSSSQAEPARTYGDDFYGSISQGLGSVLGIFCMIIPLIERNRQLQPDIPVRCPQIFRWLLGFSVLTTVLSMGMQQFEEASSIVFGYVGMATQLVATMLLVIGSTETITRQQWAYDQLSTKHLIISGTL